MASDEYSFKAFSEHAFYREVNEALLDRADLRRGWTVVDVACGSGAATALILEKIRGARDTVVIGIDMSATALRDARQKVAGVYDAVVEFVQARAEELSKAVRRAADAVVFCNGIHYIEDKVGLVKEVYGTLRPGGIFAFNTGFFEGAMPPETQKYYRRWMLKALRKLKTEYNLSPEHTKVEARKQLSPEQYLELLEYQGFVIKSQEIVRTAVPEQGYVDISRFSDFVAGALPGVPIKTASDVLVESVKETFAEVGGMTAWPRNWLSVVATRP
ncbi:MAG: class I SAM-dependent methyltransferase [Gemmatimonadota bacterium]|nr:MAG: class I SAM-dependent methyltransferase [Gemmatimonadota bacterium]